MEKYRVYSDILTAADENDYGYRVIHDTAIADDAVD